QLGYQKFKTVISNLVRADRYEFRDSAYDNLGEEQNANSARAIACQVDQTFCGAAQPPVP
ncbi:MAG: hypothetical protein MK125_02375, partial [Dehalococcoidia bacterium]|nr:hypothetical protein [Dehalococcoidia bacterium]